MNDNSPNAESVDQARVQALNATQWLARLTRSYSDRDADEVQLRWDNATGRILTAEVAPGVAVGLSLPTLMLQFDQDGAPSPHPIDIDGKSSSEVEAWVLVELLHRGIDRDCFSKNLPYQPAHLMSGDEPKYSPQELTDELKRLAESYEDAGEILVHARGLLRQEREPSETATASELICWPERMELGFTVPTFGDDQAGGLVKIAFTGGDSDDARPRYFVHREGLRPAVALPLEQIASQNMSPSDVASHLVASVGEMRASAAN